MIQTTLCLLLKEDKILLAMKKRGFGVGKWNGVGGKIDKNKGDKDVFDAIKREAKEEIGVELINPEKRAVFHFYFPYEPDWNCDVHLFLAEDWSGKIVESEEMAPAWFPIDKIPYKNMWDSDKLWIPHILAGKRLEAEFTFTDEEKVLSHNIKIVKEI